MTEVVGQEQVTRTLLNALANERISHAYLFCGPRGTGKTSTGRILAKAVNCVTSGKGEPCNSCAMCQAITEGRALDVIEVDAASNRGINEIRDLREKVNYAPNQARYKVYIIDEVHMLTNEASNALLKTLEEPPPHVIFVLATTEAHKVLPTILSRCQRFDFRRISQADVVDKLAQICDSEGIRIGKDGLQLISRAATGSLRDAENILQQLTTYFGADIELKQVQGLLGISGDWRARELVKHIINGDIPGGIATINSVNNDGLDLRQFNRELVGYLRALLLIKTGSGNTSELTAEDVDELKGLAAEASLSRILKAVKTFGQLELGLDNYSTLPLELALIDCTLQATEDKGAPARSTGPGEPARKAASPKNSLPPETTPARPEALKEMEPPARQSESVSDPEPVTPHTQEVRALGSEIEQLQANWRKFILEAPGGIGKTPAAALLRSARPKEIKDDVIVLSFRYPLHKENMEKLENQKIAEKILSGFLGRSCRVSCIYEAENNHLVKAALRMGAQVIDTEET